MVGRLYESGGRVLYICYMSLLAEGWLENAYNNNIFMFLLSKIRQIADIMTVGFEVIDFSFTVSMS